jgi:putative acetyltransferase
MKRLARHDDIEAIHRIYMDASVIPYLSHDPMDLHAFQPVLDELIAAGRFYVHEREGRVVAFHRIIRFEGRNRHVAILGLLAVHPDWQGTGLAKEIVEDAMAELKASGVIRVELLAEPDNLRGLAFYKKLGFHVESVQSRAYSRAGTPGYIDEVMLVRFLDET